MNGATSTTNVVAALHLPPNNNTSGASSDDRRTGRKATDSDTGGALATAQAVVSRSLGASGFVDLTGPVAQSLAASRDSPSAQEEIGDLKPGALARLMSFVREQIAANAETSVQGQAHVKPDAAVTLLT